MSAQQRVNSSDVLALVLGCLQEVLMQKGEPVSEALSESTCIIGHNAVLDSLGLMTFIIATERKLGEKYGITVTLANDQAVSQQNSPFRSAKFLVEYICALMKDEEKCQNKK